MRKLYVLKKALPNIIVLATVMTYYLLLGMPSQWYLKALPAAIIVTISVVIRKKEIKPLNMLLQLLRTYLLLTVIFAIVSWGSVWGLAFIIVFILSIAAFRIYSDLKNKDDSLYLDSVRSIEERIWGEPLDPIKKKKNERRMIENERK